MSFKTKRIVALLVILSLALIIGFTLYFAVTGSRYFWGMMVLMFFYPIFLWAMGFLYKWSKNKQEDQES